MKRREFLNHLSQHGCHFVREGSEHSIWENPMTKQRGSVPRHSEVNDFTARRICKSLGIPKP
jgi:mRNA interferase HicA